VKVVHSNELDLNTPQTSGMTRAAAITHAKAGAGKVWAGTMVVQPDAKTGPHHHGELETVLYVVGTNSNAMGRSTGTERGSQVSLVLEWPHRQPGGAEV
jgi:uncharacterized RmlC-like cupin family protein